MLPLMKCVTFHREENIISPLFNQGFRTPECCGEEHLGHHHYFLFPFSGK
jgi:hypothetical protein